VTGSRNGYATLMLWYALRTHSVDDLRARADNARGLAAYAHRRLAGIDWPAFRHDLAFTVVLDVPPPSVLEKWPLACDSDRAHIVCMPGVTSAQVDTFVSDLEEAASTQDARTGAGAGDQRRPQLARAA
jgi:histidine decarboxylase